MPFLLRRHGVACTIGLARLTESKSPGYVGCIAILGTFDLHFCLRTRPTPAARSHSKSPPFFLLPNPISASCANSSPVLLKSHLLGIWHTPSVPMESQLDEEYHIAWVLSSPDHHTIATRFFDEIKHRTTSASSEIVYTYGKVGRHNVVAASRARAEAVESPTPDVAACLLQEIPSIRAGFVLSPDATVPRGGAVRVGDVVFGLELGLQAGVVYFDHQETTKQKRLIVTDQSRRPPGAILTALNDLRSPEGRSHWLRHLERNEATRTSPLSPVTREAGQPYKIPGLNPGTADGLQETLWSPSSGRQPKAFGGVIASSAQELKDPTLMERISADKEIICFETMTHSMKSHSFMVVAGATSFSGDQQRKLYSNDVCNIVASYVACLVHFIDHTKLAAEFPYASCFEYEEFDLDRPGFRLLRLEAGTGPIRCHVFQAYLDDEESLIPYEALSYCWGGNHLAGTAVVNDKFLRITENLSEALLNLRQQNEDRILWVDAICIDQNNIRERGHQVKCMSGIYSRAELVLIWLGAADPEVSLLMSALKQFETKVPAGGWRSLSYEDPVWAEIWEQVGTDLPNGHERHSANHRSSLVGLLKKPWFDRVWIVQEVAKAKKASIGCSRGWVSTRSFALAPQLLGITPDSQRQAIIDIMPGPSRRSSWWTERQNLCTLLWRFRGSQANDPRDRLYALLDLASDANLDGKLAPDYTKSEAAVVKDILAYLFSDEKFSVRRIADLQNTIPNLSCMALERKVLGGCQINEVEDFVRLQNREGILSEAAAHYIWFVDTRLMDYCLKESHFEYITQGAISQVLPLQRGFTVSHFFSKTHKKEIDGRIIEAARQNGFNPFALAIKDIRDDFVITEPLAREAVRNGSGMLKVLFESQRENLRVTEDAIKEAAREEPETLRILLDMPRDQVKTVHIADAAAQTGPRTLKALLNKRGDEVKLTDALIRQAAKNGPEMLKLLLRRLGDAVEIPHILAVEAIMAGPTVLKVLLDRHGDKVEVNYPLASSAARAGPDTFRVFLDRCGDKVEITDRLAEEVAVQGPEVLRILLSRCRDKFMIPDALVEEVVKQGPELFSATLGGVNLMITDTLASRAARSGPEMLRAFLDRHGDKVTITESLTMVAAEVGPHTLRVLLDMRDRDVIITDKVVLTALMAAPQALEFLSRRGNEVKVTNSLVIASASQPWVLERLLDQVEDDASFTMNDDLIQKLAEIGMGRAPGPLRILLEKRGKDIEITRVMIERSRKYGVDLVALVMELSKAGIKITDALVEEAALSGFETVERLLLQRQLSGQME